MRFARFSHHSCIDWGVVEKGTIYPLSNFSEGEPGWADFTNPSYQDKVKAAIEYDALDGRAFDKVNTLAPVQNPGKIVGVGLNYHDHVEEQGEDVPTAPLLFSKAPTCITNPGDPIIHPADIDQVDYEVELAVVIGKVADSVSAADARQYIAGYAILNDVSARDAQFADGQFFRGKSYDTFAPLGPTLIAGNAVDPNDLDVELRVNGESKQRSSTTELVFDVDFLVEYISNVMTLRPGDVISTGTPGGVGIFRDPPDLLEPGDVVEAEVESLGILRNPVVAEA